MYLNINSFEGSNCETEIEKQEIMDVDLVVSMSAAAVCYVPLLIV